MVSFKQQFSRRLAATLFSVALIATGCPKKTADLEFEAARKAMDDARARKASDCAKESYQAAEAAIAEAKALADKGEIDAAKKRAGEAQQLAARAAEASKPGCDEVKPKEEVEPSTESPSEPSNASTSAKLEELLLAPVYFDYNDASIREDSKANLDKIAAALRGGTLERLEVEGHCDVRGATEYNLHLGERRAQSVRKYLINQGVDPNNLDVISYGEERPIDLGGSEEAHAKNRRAELRKL